MAVYEIDNVPGKIDFSGTDAERRIVQNAKNLLCCLTGEVPYDRQRGFNAELFDLPDAQLREMLPQEIDRLLLWEPRAEALSVEAERTEGGTVIRVKIEINTGG